MRTREIFKKGNKELSFALKSTYVFVKEIEGEILIEGDKVISINLQVVFTYRIARLFVYIDIFNQKIKLPKQNQDIDTSLILSLKGNASLCNHLSTQKKENPTRNFKDFFLIKDLYESSLQQQMINYSPLEWEVKEIFDLTPQISTMQSVKREFISPSGLKVMIQDLTFKVEYTLAAANSIHVSMALSLETLKELNENGLFVELASELPKEKLGYQTNIRLKLEGKESLLQLLTEELAPLRDVIDMEPVYFCFTSNHPSRSIYRELEQYQLKSWGIESDIKEKLHFYSWRTFFTKKAKNVRFKYTPLGKTLIGEETILRANYAVVRVVYKDENYTGDELDNIQIQAEFDYEQANILMGLGIFNEIKLPNKKEDSATSLYLYLQANAAIDFEFMLNKEDYPNLTPPEMILDEKLREIFSFADITKYQLLAWKTVILV